LLTRKKSLKRILPSGSANVLYVDHTKGAGQRLYELACQLDLEGIVGKRAATVSLLRGIHFLTECHYRSFELGDCLAFVTQFGKQ
jgi:hypothetical protein